MWIEVATPEQLDEFRCWQHQERLEPMTCRPVVDGQRVPPSNEVVTYGFFVADRSQPVGKFAYFDVNPRNRSAEFGYRIHPAMRGQGLGTQMLQICISRVFQSTNLNKLYCQTAAFNLPSIRLLEKLGFQRDGVLREHHELDGLLHDDYVYSLLRQEWLGQSWAVESDPDFRQKPRVKEAN
ncbi:MAG: GNAT family protein [Aulosira sp. ZfuCHP01]|nr:GNAT family protein [Aulosira sp. ZfuVER01]MDZ8001971.1 GNAT family protein [Aulosira sp. DedVER01a]MDZ8054951.1 GNAT family protein [Aulosira sp. ZfuCHP01]